MDRLRSRIARRFSTVEAEQLTTFASRLFAKGGSAYAEALADDELMAMVGGAFRFFMGAGPLPRVRAFNPHSSSDGWQPDLSIVEACMEDSPYIVDTVRDYLRRQGLRIRHFLSPVLVSTRERDGGLLALPAESVEGARESFLHVAMEHIPDEALLARVESALRERLVHMHLAACDHRRLLEQFEAVAQDLEWVAGLPPLSGRAAELGEVAAFLRWLAAGNFVVLGYQEERVEDGGEGSVRSRMPRTSLGICRAEQHSARAASRGRAEPPSTGGPLLSVITLAEESPVYPFVPMSEVTIRQPTPDGGVLGESRFWGLFTSRARAEEAADVPVLRRTLAAVWERLEHDGVVRGFCDRRELVAIFNSFAREYLLSAATADLVDDICAVLATQPDEVSITGRETSVGPEERRLAVMVSMPRHKFSDTARQRIQHLLATFVGGTLVAAHGAGGEGERACLHVVISNPLYADALWGEELSQAISDVVDPWEERLLRSLEARYPAAEARLVAARFRTAFSAAYRVRTGMATIIDHIGHILEIERSREPHVELLSPADVCGDRGTILRVYQIDADVTLGDFIPILENLGLRVHAAGDPLLVSVPDGPQVFVHTLTVQDPWDSRLNVGGLGARLEAAFLAAYAGKVENDRLNSLVMTAGLDWRAVECLRALSGYGRQIGVAPTRATIHAALTEHPPAAKALFELFCTRFAPSGAGDPAAAHTALLDCLENVGRAADKRIIGQLCAIIEATVRTNFFSPAGDEKPHIAIKVHAARLGTLPHPLPLFETYVYSAQMEGLHLRLGRVAHGGIVRTDDRDGLRTELLGLLTTQSLSNAAVVAAGAKGGFVLKDTPPDGPSVEAVRAGFTTLVRGLLDLIDNRVGPDVRHPAGLRVYDDEDPYLAIVPDAGTEGLADVANEIAAEYRFWLGDTFAAGGSHGYDPQQLRIAARGAWECVRAHLRDAGRVIDAPVVVVGTGDMADGFFGAGMLLSPTVRLRAAVSDRYIFLDPNPEPERAYAERERLAQDVLGWDAYDTAKLSPGGFVVPRAAERVELTPEARTALGMAADETDGEGLTRAILSASADVLWTGTQGTWVKASTETGPSVDGAGADPVRPVGVDACEVRAAVIAEGSYSGLTQRARVEYALTGGRINTCTIDSSGGVDLSNREISLRILFQPLVETGELPCHERDRLLAEAGAAVVSEVLSRTRAQHQVVSFDQWRSQRRLAEYREAITELHTDDAIASALDALPDRSTMRARRGRYLGLTRPELAVMLACVKVWLKRQLLEAPVLLDGTGCEPFLHRYFPAAIRQRFPSAVQAHRLRREIIASELTNELIETMGCTFIHRLVRDAEADVLQATRAWVIAWALARGRELVGCLWKDGDDPGGSASEARLQSQAALVTGLERLTRWVLRNVRAEQTAGDAIRDLGTALDQARTSLPGYFSAKEAEVFHRRMAELEMAGVARDVAHQLALTEWLDGALVVIRIATETGGGWEAIARLYFGLSDWLDFPWLLAKIADRDSEDLWDRRAALGLAEDLADARCRLVRRLLAAGATVADLHALGMPRARAERATRLVADLKGAPRVTSAALQVIVRELGRLCELG
jgi:glutamate dehydrogenase